MATTFNKDRIGDELKSLGCDGVIISPRGNRTPAKPESQHVHPSGVKVHVVWNAPPTPAQIAAVDAVIQSHDGTPTIQDKIGSAANARIIKQSAAFPSLTPQQKQAVQKMIDDDETEIIARLR